ncbi:hypothetical protein Btru_061208 [Bulinus truncatus]|nr:hypothetical protein Btru_061208 [Bulinus truncatus]
MKLSDQTTYLIIINGNIFVFNCVIRINEHPERCSINETCSDAEENVTSSTVRFVKSHTYTTSIKIYNVTRKVAGKWTLVYAESTTDDYLIHSCQLNVYAVYGDIRCHKTIAFDGLSVQCSVDKLFPQAACKFNVTLNKVFINVTGMITYKNEPLIQDKIQYFKSQCNLFIPTPYLQIGYYDIFNEMRIYMIDRIDTHFSILNNSVTLKIDRPIITLQSCTAENKKVKEIVTCECKLISSELSYSLSWFSKKSIIKSNASETLKFTFNSTSDEYFCQATNVIGLKSENLYYRDSELVFFFFLKQFYTQKQRYLRRCLSHFV